MTGASDGKGWNCTGLFWKLKQGTTSRGIRTYWLEEMNARAHSSCGWTVRWPMAIFAEACLRDAIGGRKICKDLQFQDHIIIIIIRTLGNLKTLQVWRGIATPISKSRFASSYAALAKLWANEKGRERTPGHPLGAFVVMEHLALESAKQTRQRTENGGSRGARAYQTKWETRTLQNGHEWHWRQWCRKSILGNTLVWSPTPLTGKLLRNKTYSFTRIYTMILIWFK